MREPSISSTNSYLYQNGGTLFISFLIPETKTDEGALVLLMHRCCAQIVICSCSIINQPKGEQDICIPHFTLIKLVLSWLHVLSIEARGAWNAGLKFASLLMLIGNEINLFHQLFTKRPNILLQLLIVRIWMADLHGLRMKVSSTHIISLYLIGSHP